MPSTASFATKAPQQTVSLFDHLVGAGKQRDRRCPLGCLEH
jgi:hypothetical protein